MLDDFLILGQVPGTNFQITFSELLLLLDAVLIFYLLRKHHLSPFEKIKWQYYYIRLYLSVEQGQQLRLPV